jgi:hypothetical protein
MESAENLSRFVALRGVLLSFLPLVLSMLGSYRFFIPEVLFDLFSLKKKRRY